MKRTWVLAGAGAIALALVLWRVAGRDDGAMPVAVAPPPAADTAVAAPVAADVVLDVLLLPDGAVGALPGSVQLGFGQVARDAAASAPTTREAEQAGPRRHADLADIAHWQPLAAQALPDGRVRVGPARLPRADRYVLAARGADGLRYYVADFTAATRPRTVVPLVGAGLRVHTGPGTAQMVLRRVPSAPPAAAWQGIQAREAPAVLAAFGEQPLPVADGAVVRPLAPGPVEVVLQVDGVEAERRLVTLPAGGIVDVRFDPVQLAVARAASADLELELVRQGSGTPVGGLQVTWLDGPEATLRTSDARGRVRFAGIDRHRAQRFNVQATLPAQGLPEWPELQVVEVSADDLAAGGDAGVLHHRVALRPLQWLVARLPRDAARMQRSRGAPYPIHVLQRQREGRWVDAEAAHFVETPEGLAVSIAEPGTYRVATVVSPWRVLESEAARGGDGRRAMVTVAGTRGTDVTLTLLHAGRPIVGVPVLATAPLRGLPPVSLRPDANGRVVLPGATVPRLRVEIPGGEQVDVALTGPRTTVELAVPGAR